MEAGKDPKFFPSIQRDESPNQQDIESPILLRHAESRSGGGGSRKFCPMPLPLRAVDGTCDARHIKPARLLQALRNDQGGNRIS